jgi:ankyrin repeat protein
MTIFKQIREEALPEMRALYTKMHEAAQAGDSAALKELLARWPSNKAFGYERLMPAIMYAAEQDDLPLVQRLLDAGALVDDTHFFLSESFDASDHPAGTPLSHACSSEMAAFLLDRGAHINAQDGKPLKNAITRGDHGMFRLLVDRGAEVRKWAVDFLKTACEGQNPAIVRDLVEMGADVNATLSPWDRTPLMAAARGGNIEIADILLARGADVNAWNKERVTPLLLAIEGGHTAMAERLLEHGADPDVTTSDEITAVALAIDRENPALAEALIRHGARTSPRIKERLAALTFWHDPNTLAIIGQLKNQKLLESDPPGEAEKKRIKRLVDMGTRLDELAEPASVGLMFAVGSLIAKKEALIDQIEDLIIMDADVNARTGKGYTVLMLAAQAVFTVGNLEAVIRLLIREGAQVNAVADDGTTALYWAAACGNAEAIAPLAEHGADLAARCDDGSDALMVAVSRIPSARYPQRFTGTARRLVELGAPLDNLVGLLTDGSYDQRLATVQALGEIGDKRAVEPLLEVMRHDPDRHRINFFVSKALREILGQDFGYDADRWAGWWESQGSGA